MVLPRVAIIYLSYHADPHLPDMVQALRNISYPKDRVELVIVDNPHPEYGLSTQAVEAAVIPFSGTEIPHVTYLPQKENLGFSGGNNVGMRWAMEQGFDYVLLHNDDGYLAPNAVGALVDAMERDTRIAEAQAMILLCPETDLINTSGNCFQYLGFGYGNDYRVSIGSRAFPPVEEISYASGACVMLRVSLLAEYGLWEDGFFMYHEDTEYSFRLRHAGYKIVRVTGALFYHKYQFSRSIKKFYWMERNRFALLFMLFRYRTLMLLLPILIPLEAGLWFFAWRGGWLRERQDVFRYWLRAEHWRFWHKKRQQIQARRQLTDRQLFGYIVPRIQFQEQSMQHPLVIYVANPVMTIYYWVVRTVMFW